MPIATLYVTCSDREEALRISRAVVAERLAACANILDGMTSVYHWNGDLREGTESVLLLKTRIDLVEILTQRVRELHSYDVPCIVAWSSIGGADAYFEWVKQETWGSSELP